MKKKKTVPHLRFSSRKKMINRDPSVLPGELVLSNVYEQVAPIKLINKPNLCRVNSNQSCFVSMASLTPAVSIDLFSVRILSLLNFAFVMSALNQHQFHDISIVGNFQSPFFFFFPILLEPTTAVSLFFMNYLSPLVKAIKLTKPA